MADAKCPVCKGKGTNKKTYEYREFPGGIGLTTAKGTGIFPEGTGELIPRTVVEKCHRCGGRGTVVTRDEEAA